MSSDLADPLLAIASHRLPADSAVPPHPPIRVDRDAWSSLGDRLTRQRLTGLACAAVADGRVVLSDDDLADLAARDRMVQAQALRAERLTLALCGELAAAGIAHLVLKGPAYAHSRYPDPATRPFIDVDLLVPGEAMDEVVGRCEVGGAVRLLPELRRGFDRRFAKSVTLRHPSGVDIDLHRTLTVGPLAHLVVIDDLWSDPASVEVIPGRRIPALAPDAAFLHACLHVATGGTPRLLVLRDVVETERDADLDRCARIAHRWRCTALVAGAVAAVRDRGFPVPEQLDRWASALEPTSDDRRIARAYERSRRSPRSLAIASLRHVRGPGNKVAYARAMAFPSAASLRARRRSAARQAWRVLRRPA